MDADPDLRTFSERARRFFEDTDGWDDSAPFWDYIDRPHQCPDGPHRGPQGPNEDLAQCPRCGMPSHCRRPAGEEFGGHIPDCSLPRDHEGYCQPGGHGHPAPNAIRG